MHITDRVVVQDLLEFKAKDRLSRLVVEDKETFNLQWTTRIPLYLFPSIRMLKVMSL